MMNITKLIRPFFIPRQKAIASYALHAEAIQMNVLRNLIKQTSATEWGLKYDYKHMKEYAGRGKIIEVDNELCMTVLERIDCWSDNRYEVNFLDGTRIEIIL